jgi:hypothetical protein
MRLLSEKYINTSALKLELHASLGAKYKKKKLNNKRIEAKQRHSPHMNINPIRRRRERDATIQKLHNTTSDIHGDKILLSSLKLQCSPQLTKCCLPLLWKEFLESFLLAAAF